MLSITSRKPPFNVQNPYREVRPTTSKIIFLSFEGSVTEEEYFEIVSNFDKIKTKIQFISVAEDAVNTNYKFRTPEQKLLLSKSRPKQLLERIEQFKAEKEEIYQFSKYPEDEFWIVTDVDNNTSSIWINEWNDTIKKCDEKRYGYAISNPFFEIWLLLHHLEATEEDKSFAVTDNQPYKPTSHFRNRLRRDAKAPMKKDKHISSKHYNELKIRQAIERARTLHINCNDKWPKYFATTVYILLEKIIDMIPE
ncbi:RloB family protein [Ruminiclostridium josui]|uniref:RloB family protein n=1 Tax=Ruminiclostridium josui TaxID=1499 RepID=UPI0006D24A59|nr:RloB family protein [Ruminiclostridium josui]